MSCPSRDEWLKHALGDVTLNESRTLLAHGAACEACRNERQLQRRLFDDLEAPVASDVDPEDFVTAVLERAREARPTATRELRRPWAWSLLVAAACVGLVSLHGHQAHPETQLRARGKSASVGPRIAVDVYLARGRSLLPLQDAVLAAGDRFAVRVSARQGSGGYFMAFVLDAGGDVHWLYPAYSDPLRDPAAPALPKADRSELLGQVVELEAPAPGVMRAVSLIAPRRLHVKEVEERIAALRDTPLEVVFPEAVVKTWGCAWQGS